MSELKALLEDCESGKTPQIALLRAIVVGLCSTGADLEGLEEDYRKEYETEKVGGTD